MAELRRKTVGGLAWSFADQSINVTLQFIVGIILARLLSPREFGLIGMLTIFLALSQAFVDSGFGQALIRKKDCSAADYSTVFFFNVAAGIAMTLLLFGAAGPIAAFFREPQLRPLTQVFCLSLLINAVTIVQRTQLVRRIDFKLLTKISIVASVISGAVGIGMAASGFGVWSLVARLLVSSAVQSALLWIWNAWRPSWTFDRGSLREMFGFGSKLLANGLLNGVFDNLYYIVIGKFLTPTDLGQFTRAEQFHDMPTVNLTLAVQRVTYPVLASIREDRVMLKAAYKKVIRGIMFVSFFGVLALASMAKPLVLTLIGNRWLPAAGYFQALCFVGVFVPLQAVNLNMLMVEGRSDLVLKLSLIKKALIVPTVFLGAVYGIPAMIAAMIANAFITFVLNSNWSGRSIGYPMGEQLRDILPSFVPALFVGSAMYVLGRLLGTSPPVTLALQAALGLALAFTICVLLKNPEYLYLKAIVRNDLLRRKR
jgi:teichuronic acid exporter